ncbi:XRE family transcriptional regulator [Staphylococcus casei]|uniref:Helix-turn-helix transcriptional regulator n=1 Tax=Staphylococcus casei TaxID=201828 RepID=A0ABZ2WC70_9STAP|nr:helix-turn-helix transcriptional regulator [Staphylococcus casei]OEL02696.1 hypothetical protein AST12_09620 [Staphylococcus succinus]PNZ59425.1 XRE family transcriptional regulator [Staphylococcus casei]PTI73662.1 XRE family transcriptional regulator [Staphylococcus succinus]WJE85527.1 helix-turn-helix transcriptional regulator [Staphylococcus casei]
MGLKKYRVKTGLNSYELSKRLKSIYTKTDLTHGKLQDIENKKTSCTKENQQDLAEFFNTTEENITKT